MKSKQLTWSSEQTAIFNSFLDGADNVVVEALAGTGKTTTIIEGLKRIFAAGGKTAGMMKIGHVPMIRRALYAVFNKRNQREADAKISIPELEVRTLHSVGYHYIRRQWPRAQADDLVDGERADMVLVGTGKPHLKSYVAQLVGFLKNTFINPSQQDAYDTMQARDLCGSDAREDEMIVCAALRVLELSRKRDKQSRISFNDMVWLPVANDWVSPLYDLVVVDECQDMNTPQLVMARKACLPNGRVIVVGDSHQAIYGFRGAAQDGMKIMKRTLNAQSLALTTTYRSGRAIVEKAREIVPEYRAADGCHEGEVAYESHTKMLQDIAALVYANRNSGQFGVAILSRLNAPLMPIALNLIRRNIPARIEGRDIGKHLLTIVKTLKTRDIEKFIENIRQWEKKQCERLADSKNAEKKMEQVHDVAETLQAVALDCDSVDEVETRLRDLFQDTDEKSKPAVVLSSVHKAKGLEWSSVYLLNETFRRGRGSEEDNIWYVAVTRAINRLSFVGGASPEPSVSDTKQAAKQAANTPETRLDSANDQRAGALKPLEAPGETTKAAPGHAVSASYSSPLESLPGYDAAARSWESPLPGCTYVTPGTIIRIGGSEYVCVRLGQCNARVVPIVAKTKEITFREDGTMEKKTKEINVRSSEETISAQIDRSSVVRRMTSDELQKFLSGRVAGEKRSNNKQTTTETGDSMKKEKSKTANKSKSGSAEYMRKLYDSGVSKKEAFEKMLEKFPAFSSFQEGLERRWRTAERLAKSAEASAKIAAKKEKSEAKEKPAKKAPAPVAKKATKKAPATKPATAAPSAPPPRASGPPPRPSAATQPELGS